MVAKFYHDAARWLTTMATITSIKDEICFVNITYMLLLILRKSHILTFLNHKSRLEIKCPPCIEPISQIAECCPHLLAQLLNLLTWQFWKKMSFPIYLFVPQTNWLICASFQWGVQKTFQRCEYVRSPFIWVTIDLWNHYMNESTTLLTTSASWSGMLGGGSNLLIVACPSQQHNFWRVPSFTITFIFSEASFVTFDTKTCFGDHDFVASWTELNAFIVMFFLFCLKIQSLMRLLLLCWLQWS